jgi:hypothetical protein
MRNRITYGQSLVLCSQPPAFQSNTLNVSGLKRVQNCDIEFSFARERFKQVGSEDFVGDVHLRNADIRFSLNYYYSNGANEALMGLNVDGNSGHALKYVKKENQDRNYYIVQGSGENFEPLNETSFLDNYNVMGLGNVFLDSYSFSASVGAPITVSTSLSAYNMQLDDYNESNGEYIPAIDSSNGTTSSTHKYKILTGNIKNVTNLDGYIDAALSPNDIELVLPSDINVAGLEFTGNGQMAHIQSFELSFNIDRHDLYGFGSMYPYGRRAILPVLGSLNFSAIASEFTTGTLHTIINSGEKEFDFTFNFLNCSGQTGLQLDIEKAKMDSQSFGESIGDNAAVDISFSFPMSSTTGFRVSTPPLIIDQPEDSASAMTTTATGKTPITYKWFDASDDSQVATGPSYNPTIEGDYYCVAYNDLGSGISKTAHAT